MTVFNDIRAALETGVKNVTGIPSDIAWENVVFEPTTGTAWARVTLSPTETMPAARGDSAERYSSGLFLVDLFYPSEVGAGTIDAIADAVMEHFSVSDVFTAGTTNVRIRNAERGQGIIDSPWYQVPVTVNWYAYHN